MISIVDYGMGNLQSVQQALAHIGAQSRFATTADEVASAEQLILPGVGAFGDAMEHLREQNMVTALKDYANSGRPMAGICLGMQLLFEASDEAPGVQGLGIFRGVVRKFRKDMGLKVPHMGWNTLAVRDGNKLLAGLERCSLHLLCAQLLHCSRRRRYHSRHDGVRGEVCLSRRKGRGLRSAVPSRKKARILACRFIKTLPG